MLRAIDIIGEKHFQKGINEALRNTVNFLLKVKFTSGNIPASYPAKRDSLVHFCHGPTGAVVMFLTAYQHFKDEKYLVAALKVGEAIWRRGLILSGNGLCHSITGNIYPFLTLAKFKQGYKWKLRAYQFALLALNKDIIKMRK